MQQDGGGGGGDAENLSYPWMNYTHLDDVAGKMWVKGRVLD